jgi:predicted ATPase/DNA-binding SARP family transcriptional activator
MAGRWRIELFGGLRVAREQIVVAGFCNQKAAELLAYLAYYLHRVHSREMLADLLWPECDPQIGRHRLSNALSWLRRAPDVAGLSLSFILKADRATIQLDPTLVTSDVAEFEATLDAAARARLPDDRARHLTHAIRDYGGALLPGDPNGWALGERERLAERFFQALAQLVDYCEQSGDLEGALEYVHQGLRLDPLREEIHRDAMRLYAALGRPDAARRQFAELQRLLRNELGVPPSAASHALLARMDGEDSWSPLSLPAALTSFFGREDEIGRLCELLGSGTPERRGQEKRQRLVTLTGPGGSGKTRLALETARRMAPAWRGGVGFVSLADIAHPQSILEAIRGALQVPPTPGVDVLDQVVTALRRRPTLLLLDTFEHLVEEGAPRVRSLLERVPSLTCLVTSRRPLAIEGEWEFPVLPLPVPADASDLLSYSSVQIFVDRVQAVCPDFRVTPENADVVAGICRRLEGIPLALELAAAWARMLTPAQIMGQLNERFDLLVSRRHDVVSRHRTLRAAIDWSYRLLGSGDRDGAAPLQRVFARLAVFQAGCDLEGAAAVCALPGWGTRELLDALTALSEQSLLQRQQDEGWEARYHMLETIREYAWERLLACGEEPEIRRRHALHFLSQAEQLDFDDFAEREGWLTRLQREHENLRSALAKYPRSAPGRRVIAVQISRLQSPRVFIESDSTDRPSSYSPAILHPDLWEWPRREGSRFVNFLPIFFSRMPPNGSGQRDL